MPDTNMFSRSQIKAQKVATFDYSNQKHTFVSEPCEPLDKLTPFLTHGEVFVPKRCHTCECNDGHVECSRIDQEKDCPKLSCPSNQRIVEEGKCCPICRGKSSISA